MRVRVKICCIASASEARSAAVAGADAVGLVGPMPTGPGTLNLDRAWEIAASVAPGVTPFLLTAQSEAEVIVAEAQRVGVPVVQVVRHVMPETHEVIHRLVPHLRIVQAVHVEDEDALELAKTYAETADALLLDSGRPGADEFGGAGRPHDWKISRQIVQVVEKPVYLAGGLHEGNVGEAIERVRPFGVDLCGGVRTMGKLDLRKLSGFFAAVRRAG